jgi:hypothetical protein
MRFRCCGARTGGPLRLPWQGFNVGHSVVTLYFTTCRTSTEFPMKSNQSRVPVLTVFAGEIEEVDFVRRFGHVSAVVVEASDTDVVQHSDEHVLFSDNMCGVVMT